MVNDSSPIPAHVVKLFISANPLSLQKLWYKIAVIAICQNKVINGDVLKLFLREGPKDTLVSAVRKNLLPKAVRIENKSVVSVLIDHFPWVLSEKLEPNDEIPLHICCSITPELLSLLLMKGICYNVGGRLGVGGLFVENIHGESLFYNLIQALLTPEIPGKESRSMKWERLEACLHYINIVMTGNAKRDPKQKLLCSGIRFSNIVFLPPELLDEAMENVHFEFELSDIFNLIEIATSGGVWNSRLKLGSNDLARTFRTLLSTTGVKINENKIQPKQSSPLHFGAFKGLKWCEGLEEILLADYNTLAKPDELTGFVPFIAAASGPSKELTTIYQLLLSDPSQLLTQRTT